MTRAPDPAHVAFGFAEHFCLGANLARRETRIVLSELLSRFPNYEVVGPITTHTPAHDPRDQNHAGGLPPLTSRRKR